MRRIMGTDLFQPEHRHEYPDEIIRELIMRLAGGETLLSICRDPRMPSKSAVYEWKDSDKVFGGWFARARLIGYDNWFEEVREIATTPEAGEVVTEMDGPLGSTKIVKRSDMLEHRKLKIDATLKLLARVDPSKYGDKVAVEHSGKLSLSALIEQSHAIAPGKPALEPPTGE